MTNQTENQSIETKNNIPQLTLKLETTDIVPIAAQVSDFYKRLIKAKMSFDPVLKDVSGFGYKYADLDGVIKATDKHLHANNIMVQESNIKGILYMWLVDAESGAKFCEFEREITSVAIKDRQGNAKNNELQAEGAGITYLRRYGRVVILGLAMEDDDASENGRPQQQKYTPEQITLLRNQIITLGDKLTDEEKQQLSKLKQEKSKDNYGEIMFALLIKYSNTEPV